MALGLGNVRPEARLSLLPVRGTLVVSVAVLDIEMIGVVPNLRFAGRCTHVTC